MDKLIQCQAEVLAENLLGEAAVDPKLPVRIQQADGKVINGVFHGYWDLRPAFPEVMPAVSRQIANGDWTTGMLHAGEKILDPVPSFEEMSAQEQTAA